MIKYVAVYIFAGLLSGHICPSPSRRYPVIEVAPGNLATLGIASPDCYMYSVKASCSATYAAVPQEREPAHDSAGQILDSESEAFNLLRFKTECPLQSAVLKVARLFLG